MLKICPILADNNKLDALVVIGIEICECFAMLVYDCKLKYCGLTGHVVFSREHSEL